MTLIELIFTIIIIGAVFTVIPRIIYVSNKALEFSKREDSMFNMMGKIMDISLKEYDENNTNSDDILVVNEPPKYVLDCNASNGYRIGGFKGSRNCLNNIGESYIPTNKNGEYDYIEGYNGVEENTSLYGRTYYSLYIKVGYTGEWNKSNYDYAKGSLDYDFSSVSDNNKTNIKRIYIVVSQNGNNVSSVNYYSANIGHIRIESVRW